MPLKGLGLGWGGVAVVVEWVVERVGMGSCTGGRGWGESGGKVGPWALWEGVAVAVGGCAKGGQEASRLPVLAPTKLLPPSWELLGLPVHPEVVPTGLLVHPSELVQAREVVLRECCGSRVADPSKAPGRGGSIRVVDPSAARVGPRISVPTSVW